MRRETVKLNAKGKVQIIAHRGMSALETENTAAAFIAAGNSSCYGVETDIYRTADGQFILNHDGNSGRICNENLVMTESTLADLQALVLNDINTGLPRNDLRLCTPKEYRDICEHYAKVCVPELKNDFTLEEIRAILDIFDGYLDKTCFISNKMDNLDKVKQLCPEQTCQFLSSSYKDVFPTYLKEHGVGMDIAGWALTQERVETLVDAGIPVNVWTIDDPEAAEQFIRWGVSQITSNILEVI